VAGPALGKRRESRRNIAGQAAVALCGAPSEGCDEVQVGGASAEILAIT
jgi:hypothetical protein